MRYIDADKLDTRERGNNSQRTMWREIKWIVDNAPAADVVPKSEVERLNVELEACEKHAAIEAVKEVWRELRSKCDAPHWCVWLSEIDDYFEKKTGVKTEDLADLKKKYTEEAYE